MRKIRNEELGIEEEKLIIPNSSFQISNSMIDPVLQFFSDRCRNLQIRKEAGLLKEWNGVFEFMDK